MQLELIKDKHSFLIIDILTQLEFTYLNTSWKSAIPQQLSLWEVKSLPHANLQIKSSYSENIVYYTINLDTNLIQPRVHVFQEEWVQLTDERLQLFFRLKLLCMHELLSNQFHHAVLEQKQVKYYNTMRGILDQICLTTKSASS